MKRLIILSFAVSIFAACTSSSSNVFSVATGEQALNTHTFKSIVVTYYTFKDGEMVVDQNGVRDSLEYLPNGLLLKECSARSRMKYVYYYDALNRVDSVRTYIHGGSSTERDYWGYRKYKYDDLNRITSIVEYDNEGAEKDVTIYRYVGNKRIIENFEKLYTNGTKQYTMTDVCKDNYIVESSYKSQYSDNTTRFKYDDNGNLIQEATTYKDDDGKSVSTFNYENGLVLDSDYSDGDGRLYEYEFNDRGDWTKREVFSKKGHSPISKAIREIEYY